MPARIIRLRVEEVPLVHRASQGVKLIDLDDEERLVGVACVDREEKSREEEGMEDENGDMMPEMDMLPGIIYVDDEEDGRES